jgi:SAM-dependent methyltransferase
MPEHDPKKFDPGRAHMLDAPERERYLPTGRLVALLELQGDETVVDYGAGTGRLSRAVADALAGGGEVVAVDESEQMAERLADQLADVPRTRVLHISDNHVPLLDDRADRVLAVNLLHEVRGESALAEMRRLLRPGRFVLVVDWERGRERDSGPPDELLYTAAEAADELRGAGLVPEPLDADLPFHFAVKASKTPTSPQED